jgi:hypothetical protein
MEFPSEIPERLQDGARYLPDGSGWVWHRSDVVEVIDSLDGSWVVIHSGEVYQLAAWGWVPVGDGWVCEPIHGELASGYANRSHDLARDFVEDRPEKDEWVLLVLSEQDEAA